MLLSRAANGPRPRASPVRVSLVATAEGQRAHVTVPRRREDAVLAASVPDAMLGAGAAVVRFVATLGTPVLRGAVAVLRGAVGLARRGVPTTRSPRWPDVAGGFAPRWTGWPGSCRPGCELIDITARAGSRRNR